MADLDIGSDSDNSEHDSPETPVVSPSVHKRKRSATPTSDEDDTSEAATSDSDREPARVVKRQRAVKMTDAERCAELENDVYTKEVGPHHVRCRCGKHIKLNQKRKYAMTNWKRHRKQCTYITGIAYKRTPVPVIGEKGEVSTLL